MRKEISQFIEKARGEQISDGADKLLNEMILIHSTLEEALKSLGGISSLKGSASLELKADTDVIKELAEITNTTMYSPSEFSPYCWMMLHENIDGSDEDIRFTIKGSKWKISQVWEDTQVH
jgi:hypothetical protein